MAAEQRAKEEKIKGVVDQLQSARTKMGIAPKKELSTWGLVCAWVRRTGDRHGLVPILLILPPLARHVPQYQISSSPLHPSIHLLTITEAPAVIRPVTRAGPEAPRVLIPEEKQLLVCMCMYVCVWMKGRCGPAMFNAYCCIVMHPTMRHREIGRRSPLYLTSIKTNTRHTSYNRRSRRSARPCWRRSRPPRPRSRPRRPAFARRGRMRYVSEGVCRCVRERKRKRESVCVY